MHRVNIVIPTYNYGRFIKDAIESALSQTYKNIRITILDNASTDNTKEVVKPYLKRKNVRYIRNKKNLGFIGNLEKALRINKDPYLCFLAADDMLAKNAIELELKYLKKFNVGLAQGNMIMFITHRGRIIKIRDYQQKKQIFKSSNPLHGYHITGTLIDTKKMKEYMNIAKIDTSTKYVGWDKFIYGFVKKYSFVWVPDIISFFRIHGSNFGISYKNDDIKEIFEYHRETGIKNSLSYYFLSYAVSALMNFRKEDAKKLILNALREGSSISYILWFLYILPNTIYKEIVKIIEYIYYSIFFKGFVDTPALLKAKEGVIE